MLTAFSDLTPEDFEARSSAAPNIRRVEVTTNFSQKIIFLTGHLSNLMAKSTELRAFYLPIRHPPLYYEIVNFHKRSIEL